MSIYDAIVVGAGPSGTTVAFLLAKKGYKVLIIDKAKFPRQKLCGGMVSLKTFKLIIDIFGESRESLYSKGIFDYNTNGYVISYRLENDMLNGHSHIDFHLVNREPYDMYFLERARDAGADIIQGKAVIDVDINNKKVILSSGENFEAKFLIGADGANSLVRKVLIQQGICDGKKWFDLMATCIECYIDRCMLKENKFPHPILIFGFVKWGYAWVFPNKNRIVVGIGGLTKKNKGNYMAIFKELLAVLGLDSLNPKIRSHPVPYGNFNAPAVTENGVLMVGDAGGFVDPLWGEGLFLAHKTAQYAAESIDECMRDVGSIVVQYTSKIKKNVLPELTWATRLQRFCFHPLNTKFKFAFLKFLLKSMTKQFLELIHGERSYIWLKKKSHHNPL